MAENTKIAAIPLSGLPEIKEPSGFWIFGSKKDSNGALSSGKYLFENLAEYAKQLQLERRMSINMGLASPYEMFIGEEMIIYRVEAMNVSKLWVDGIEVLLGKTVSVKIKAKSLVEFKVEKVGTEPTGYLFIYAKATLP